MKRKCSGFVQQEACHSILVGTVIQDEDNLPYALSFSGRIRGRHIALETKSASAPRVQSIFFHTTVGSSVFGQAKAQAASKTLYAQRSLDLPHPNSAPE